MWAGFGPAEGRVATITRRGKRWRAKVRRLGVALSQTFGSKSAAQTWAAATEAEIVARSRGQVITGHTLKQALQEYSARVSTTHRGAHWEQIRLKMFERIIPFAGRPVDRLQPAEFATWRDARLLSVSASTVRREMGLLTAIMEVARKEWRWTASNPLSDVRKPSEAAHRTRTVQPWEWRALLRAVGWLPGRAPQSRTAWAVACFALATRTAMRAGEIVGLQAVDSERRVAHLPMTKNGKPRDVPLSRQAMRILDGLTLPVPLNSRDLDALWRRARGLAGIEGLHFHDGRHTATTMLAKKLSIMELARVTGHSDTKMLMRYFHPDVASLADRLR
jgi:integrase